MSYPVPPPRPIKRPESPELALAYDEYQAMPFEDLEGVRSDLHKWVIEASIKLHLLNCVIKERKDA